jgi:hypothetical protein
MGMHWLDYNQDAKFVQRQLRSFNMRPNESFGHCPGVV